ncbi:MAG: hypothetical protein JWM21_2015 [Acidobacteria bacterium]|nr:hypothetical protein [Acidobacteriota bacterium]
MIVLNLVKPFKALTRCAIRVKCDVKINTGYVNINVKSNLFCGVVLTSLVGEVLGDQSNVVWGEM